MHAITFLAPAREQDRRIRLSAINPSDVPLRCQFDPLFESIGARARARGEPNIKRRNTPRKIPLIIYDRFLACEKIGTRFFFFFFFYLILDLSRLPFTSHALFPRRQRNPFVVSLGFGAADPLNRAKRIEMYRRLQLRFIAQIIFCVSIN